MPEFLPKDPTKALFDIKEKLYDRLTSLRSYIDIDSPADRLEHHIKNEVEFLEKLIDTIERSWYND